MFKLSITKAIKWLKSRRRSEVFYWGNTPSCLFTRVVRGVYPAHNNRKTIVHIGGAVFYHPTVTGRGSLTHYHSDGKKVGSVPFHNEFWNQVRLRGISDPTRDEAIEVLRDLEAKAKIAARHVQK